MTIFLICLAGAVAFALLAVSATHNRLMQLDERCESAFADVDVQLKHRHNLIPGLVETVRGFASHERGVLTEVTQARAGALQAAAPNMRLEAETQLGQSLTALMSVVEKYPEIAASGHFRELRAELSDSENRITAARRFYNLAVAEYNATLRQFPGNLIAQRKPLDRRRTFDLGVERVLIDEPVPISF
ncbi:MAG TPA: LemA family protein [Sphingomonadaceae bacterium]|nr:LemA family protein [Sphingomonadaceae bacterium]